MIEFRDVSFVYDGRVLFRNFSNTVAAGEKVVVTGPSGIGKSTLLGGIAGFTVPDEGEICVDGMAVTPRNLTGIRRRLAWIPQEFTLPYGSVREMAETIFHLKANRKISPEQSRIAESFGQLGLEPELYERKLIEISGGQRQRIMIALAALLDKEIILLDEPTSALDQEAVDAVIRFLRDRKNCTMVAVSHDPHFINAFDRVLRLSTESTL